LECDKHRKELIKAAHCGAIRMSRYVLLLLLNLPFVFLAVLSAITQYKLNRSTRKRMVIQISAWLLVVTGLALAQPFYDWLIKNRLTITEPLSLFDVVQITALVIIFYAANQNRAKVDVLERRVQDLHQELSIRLSTRK
jgi:hypothetical protein